MDVKLSNRLSPFLLFDLHRYARRFMKLTTSNSAVQTRQALARRMWLDLKHFGSLALHCLMAERHKAMQASGTRNQNSDPKVKLC